MPQIHLHQEKALYCGCMDGRAKLTAAMLQQYDACRQDNGEAFRLFWGGGPYLFLVPEQREFAITHLLLAYKVNPFEVLYLTLHMGCGAYTVLGKRTFASREEEIVAKWADLDAIIQVIKGLKTDEGQPLELSYVPALLDVDGSEISRP